jgi:hypothetical protein
MVWFIMQKWRSGVTKKLPPIEAIRAVAIHYTAQEYSKMMNVSWNYIRKLASEHGIRFKRRHAVLAEEQAVLIRECFDEGLNRTQTSERLGCHSQTVAKHWPVKRPTGSGEESISATQYNASMRMLVTQDPRNPTNWRSYKPPHDWCAR